MNKNDEEKKKFRQHVIDYGFFFGLVCLCVLVCVWALRGNKNDKSKEVPSLPEPTIVQEEPDVVVELDFVVDQAFKALKDARALRAKLEDAERRAITGQIEAERRARMPYEAMQAVVHITAYCDTVGNWDDEYYKAQGDSWQGSGCFVSDDGVIMTAGHVVEGADRSKVRLSTGEVIETTCAMLAENLDVGFLKIEFDEPTPYQEFDRDGVQLAERVFIFGHPFGEMNEFSVTSGIISNLNRDCEGFFGEFLMIQSDAASWPGNSGGPVLDEDGEIVGILVGSVVYQECLSYISPADPCLEWLEVFEAWLDTRIPDAETVGEEVESPST